MKADSRVAIRNVRRGKRVTKSEIIAAIRLIDDPVDLADIERAVRIRANHIGSSATLTREVHLLHRLMGTATGTPPGRVGVQELGR